MVRRPPKARNRKARAEGWRIKPEPRRNKAAAASEGLVGAAHWCVCPKSWAGPDPLCSA